MNKKKIKMDSLTTSEVFNWAETFNKKDDDARQMRVVYNTVTYYNNELLRLEKEAELAERKRLERQTERASINKKLEMLKNNQFKLIKTEVYKDGYDIVFNK